MSRLRYNGIQTTLGATLNSTTITFAAALTYNNGTNVPTIVAGDYIPLSILSPAGLLEEIVYLTAYTAAATTGTVVRGREGTPSANRSSGDTVVGASTLFDLQEFDLRPIGNSQDDEFDGLSAASWTNTPTAPTAWNVAGGKLYIRSNGNGTPFPLVGKYQSIPSYPFTVETKLSATNIYGNASLGGMFITSAGPSGSSPCFVLTLVGATTGATVPNPPYYTQRVKYTAFNANTFSTAATATPLTGVPPIPRYLRIIATNATSFATYASLDGINWRTIETGFNPGFTPGVMGLFACENAQTDIDATFDYFRVS